MSCPWLSRSPQSPDRQIPRRSLPPPLPTPQTEVPSVPGLSFLKGANAGITFASLHDSFLGWSTFASPAVGYSFNDVFAFDATVPIYFYRLAESRSARPRANSLLANQRGEAGDVVLGLHAHFLPSFASYEGTFSIAAPTGDAQYGLSTGRVTFDLSNHFERACGRFTPSVELGIGDSSALVNRVVVRNFTSLGPLAHFQLGTGVAFRRFSFETQAYEQLPVGDQKIYGPSRNGRATIVLGRNITEDNGFINALDIPLDRHTILSGYYSRSLRLREDVVSVGITYLLRPAPREDDPNLNDLFP